MFKKRIRYRIPIALIFLATSCAFQEVLIELNPDKVNLSQLDSKTLLIEISKKTSQYKALSNSDAIAKQNMALVLGYLHYQNKNFSASRHYFSLFLKGHTNAKEHLLKEYAYFYLGRMAVDEKNCSLAASYEGKIREEFPNTSVDLRFKQHIERECKPNIIPKTLSLKERKRQANLNLFDDANRAFEERNYKEAIVKFKRFLARVEREAPQVEDTLVNLSIIYKRLGDLKNYEKILWSLAKYQKADKKFPYNPKWMYEISRYYWNKEKIIAAKKYLIKLIQWPHHRYVGTSYFILAKLAAENKQYKEAIQYLMSALPTAPIALKEEIAYLTGWYSFKTKNFKETIKYFKAFRSEYPDSDYAAMVTYWLARTYDYFNKSDEAREFYQELYDKIPFSYYGIRSAGRLKITIPTPKFKQDLSWLYSRNSFRLMNPLFFTKGESLIKLGLGEDGKYELNQAGSLETIFKTSWKFQYYLSSLYALGGDHISSFIILNELQKNYLNDLSDEYLYILYPKRYWPLILEYAQKFKVDPYLILSIMRQESAFDPKAISSADAYGLLQITPLIAREMAKRLKKAFEGNEALLDPRTNLLHCVFYLSELLKESRGDVVLSLATYNANSQTVQKWTSRLPTEDIEEFIEDIPYPETRMYVKLILRNYTNYIYLYESVFLPFAENTIKSSNVYRMNTFLADK